jgi:tetratricopeptide (TPR) repeat protein
MVAIVCYVNVLPNDFCYDGAVIVRDNAVVNDPGQWAAIWTTDYWSESVHGYANRDLLYRPVALTSYRLVRAAFGVRPFPHHVVNLLLYAAVCSMVARLAYRTTERHSIALISGALFAVLPIHTEVLNDVVGRADLLAAGGMLATVLAHRRSLIAESQFAVAAWRVCAAMTAFLAMGSKESAIGLVGVVPLFDAMWHRSMPEARRGSRWVSLRTVGRLAYLLVPAAIYLWLRYHALGGALHQAPQITKAVNVLVDVPWWQHVLGAVQLWGMYWAKMLWPQVLCINYSINAIRLATDPFDVHVLWGAGVTFLLAVAALVSWRRGRPNVALLVTAMLITYAPTSNTVILLQVFFGERIWFIPSIWAAILLGMIMAKPARRPLITMVIVLLMAGMVARCWIRNSEWRNNGTLFASAYRDLPQAVGVQHLYGQWLVNNGHFEEGVPRLLHAIEIDPGFTDAHRSLGTAYLREGRVADALRHLQIANLLIPGHPPTEAALARAGGMIAAADATLEQLRELEGRQPDNFDVHIALVRRLREVGQAGEALRRMREREAAFGDRVEWLAEYAVTLQTADRREEALMVYRRCLTLTPENAQLAMELASLLLERRAEGDLDEAWKWLDHAARIAPNAPMLAYLKAEILVVRGRPAEALELLEQAIRGSPPDSPHRRIFEERAAALGRRP